MAPSPRTSAAPSVRLALSGGGYRAMLFHVGALWKLNEIGELSRVTHISSVSGGSITAGVLAMNWARLEFKDGVATDFSGQVAAPLMRLARWTLDYPAAVSALLPFCSAARTMEFLYKRLVFGLTTLGDLPSSPRFTLNATNLQTGAAWTFERDTMGDRVVGRVPSASVPLARAVAASSAFPPFLAPLVLKPRHVTWHTPAPPPRARRAYDDLAIRPVNVTDDEIARLRRRVVLVDGGVADNLGILPVWGDDVSDLYVSDGGGASQPTRRPAHNWLGQLIRIVNLIHDQPSQLRANRSMAEMANRDQGRGARRERNGDGAVWNMHWPPEDHDHDPDFPDLDRIEWAHLAQTPTRLGKMSPELQAQLINWGYIACNRSLPYVNRLFAVGPYASAFNESPPFPKGRV